MDDVLVVSVIIFLPLATVVSAFLLVTYVLLFIFDGLQAVITNLKKSS